MLCPHCEFDNPPGAGGCDNCGRSVNELSEPAIPLDALQAMEGARVHTEPFRVHGIRTALVGREAELARLETHLEEVLRTHEARLVTVLGTDGMGKSRLVSEFIRRHKTPFSDLHVCRGYVPGNRATAPPYGLFSRLLMNRFGIVSSDDAEVERQKVREGLEGTFDGTELPDVLHFLGNLLHIDFPGSPSAQSLEAVGTAPGNGRLEMLSYASLRYFFEQDARRTPLILTFERIDRATSESLELLRYLATTLSRAPVLMIATATPTLIDRVGEWGNGRHHDNVALGPLNETEAHTLLRRLLDGVEGVPDMLFAVGWEKSLGTPFLLEEFVRVLFSGGGIDTSQSPWAFSPGTFDPDSLPQSLEDALEARFDRLSHEDRELLAQAAVMGAEFRLGGLAALMRLERRREGDKYLWDTTPWLEELRVRLDTLVSRNAIRPLPGTSRPGDEAWAFVHDSERQAFLALLDDERRQRYHRHIAQWLQHRGDDDATLVAVAHHLEESGAPGRAAGWYMRAAERAVSRFANEAARESLERALALLDPDDALSRIDARHQLGSLADLAGDRDAALAHFTRMLELAWLVDNPSKGGAAYNRIGRIYRARGDQDRALDALGRGLALFDSAGDRRGVAASLDDIGKVHWLRADTDEALAHYNRAIEIRRSEGDQRGIALSLHNLGMLHQLQADFDASIQAHTDALEIRKELGDIQGVSASLSNIGVVHHDLGRTAEALEIWAEALTLTRETGDRLREAILLDNMGEACLAEGDAARARGLLDRSVKLATDLDERPLLADALRNLGMVAVAEGNLDSARELTDGALELATDLGMAHTTGACLTARGIVLAAAANPEGARHAFGEAIDTLSEARNTTGARELFRSLAAYADFLDTTALEADAGEGAKVRARAEALAGGN